MFKVRTKRKKISRRSLSTTPLARSKTTDKLARVSNTHSCKWAKYCKNNCYKKV